MVKAAEARARLSGSMSKSCGDWSRSPNLWASFPHLLIGIVIRVFALYRHLRIGVNACEGFRLLVDKRTAPRCGCETTIKENSYTCNQTVSETLTECSSEVEGHHRSREGHMSISKALLMF